MVWIFKMEYKHEVKRCVYIYIYIYIVLGLATSWSKTTWCSTPHYFHFENPNDRSEPFILYSILICAWRPNFTFFGIFLLFIKPLWKSPIQWSRKFYCFYCSPGFSDFQSGLINSKKIPKNVKFSFQAYFNID